MARKKMYQTRVQVPLSMDATDKTRYEQAARCEGYPSLNAFFLDCAERRVNAMGSVEATRAELARVEAERQHADQLASAKRDEVVKLEASLSAMVGFDERTKSAFEDALKHAVEATHSGIPRGRERDIALGNAADLFARFSRRITPDEILAKAYEIDKSRGMFR